jgi:hypothetical protein
LLANVASDVKVIGAFAPTVSTTIFPQLVTKVKVVGKTRATFFGCTTDGAACGFDVAFSQIFTGSFGAAETAGANEADRPIAIAITKVRFIMAEEYRLLT